MGRCDRVLPTSAGDGMIEYVPSVSLARVLAEHRTIHRFLLLHNEDPESARRLGAAPIPHGTPGPACRLEYQRGSEPFMQPLQMQPAFTIGTEPDVSARPRYSSTIVQNTAFYNHESSVISSQEMLEPFALILPSFPRLPSVPARLSA